MKKILFIFLLLTTTKTFSQDYRDKIVKSNGDTISCRITLINSEYIYYHINKSGDKSKSLWQKEIVSIYLDSTSKPIIDGSNLNINFQRNKYTTFSQDYRDKIVRINGDTINCRITLINQDYIYYHINNAGDKRKSIWQKEINSVYIDTASKAKIEVSNLNMNFQKNNFITFNKLSSAHLDDSLAKRDGIYISAGIGSGATRDLSGFGYDLSFSYAIKSHLISITATGCTTVDIFGPYDYHTNMYSYYFGILFGESLRGKNGMCSASIGVASGTYQNNYFINTGSSSGNFNTLRYNGFSCPVEVKLFVFLVEYAGFGLKYSVNLTPLYCPYYLTFSLMIGILDL